MRSFYWLLKSQALPEWLHSVIQKREVPGRVLGFPLDPCSDLKTGDRMSVLINIQQYVSLFGC